MKYKLNYQNNFLPNIKGFIFDLDGVFYKSNEPLKGGYEIVKYLKMKNIPFAFFTNNSQSTPIQYVEKLANMNINIEIEQVLTSGILVQKYVNEEFNSYKTGVFGSKELKRLFKNSSKNPELIIVGMHRNITLGDISTMRNYAKDGKQFIFTNPDKLIPIKDGYDFECGTIIKILEPYFKKKPIIIGKPNIYGYEYLINYLKIKKEFLAFVGDTYETDIKGAIDSNLIPIHLQTSDKSYNNNQLKAYEFEDLLDLLKYIKENNEVYTSK